MIMKKFLALLLAAMMVLGMTACGSNGDTASTDDGGAADSGETATGWPEKTINLYVTHAAGGDTDYMARQLATLLDFNQAAFVTDTYVAGATVNTTPATTTPSDNLNTLSGSFRRFSPCNCDLLEISALVNTLPETSTGVTATQVPLCQLTAVVLQTATAPASGDTTSEQATANNFQTIQCILSQCLTPCANQCGTCCCPCNCTGDECCCAAGLLSTLSQSNLSRQVSIVAGPLVLQGVTLLGTVGNVLVLSNSANNRIYFVCVNQIQFLA